MKHNKTIEPELSRPLAVDKIPAGGVEEHIIASSIERKALAERFGLLDLLRLEARLDADHAENGLIEVTGVMTADVVQQCVVTLDPVETHIDDIINVVYAPARMLDVGAKPQHSDMGDEEAPEPIVNGIIDLGELVAQHLAVALDPYPRKPGAKLEENTVIDMQNSGTHKPFAELVKLGEKVFRGKK